MPYKSEKQRRFMEAKHPEIAARWRKKGHAYVQKDKSGWAKPLALGAGSSILGGAVANQVPRVSVNRKKKKVRLEAAPDDPRAKLTFEKRGRISKIQITSDDPLFNQKAAQKAFDLVMKMDDDTAEMFCLIVASDLFETDLERNLGTLQRHLNEVVEKRLTDLKQAHMRLVSKGMDSEQAVAYAQAIALLDGEFSKKQGKKNPYQYGYQWREEDFNRDPSSGRFRLKIRHSQSKLMDDRSSQDIIGTKTPKKFGDERLSPEDRIRFQDEYRQLADFLGAISESTSGAGNQEVLLHYRDKAGRSFSQLHRGTVPPKEKLLDPSTRLVGVEAKPTTLTAGGAAFGLATALGGELNPQQVQRINQADKHSGTFSNDWLKAGDDKNTNQRLYDRMATGGTFLSQLGPPGSKTQMAGRFAQLIGQHGPEAESVLGPTARKTSYRYRGTEKTPEKEMMTTYAAAIEQGKQYGAIPHEELASRLKQRPTQERAPVPMHRQAAERAAHAERAPEWGERELGRQKVVDHLRHKLPQKNLYSLQMASGNTPPSEGVIINADGQIATQAVGYADDHYLPFNLKNLKALKGGEYIRTRSVGGLTSEDIYTGLISGARQVTVTSRSGTYTMTFEPDFRGGRRHNDKARRMTRRYEQLLDAVQSEQVDRTDIDPEMRLQIEAEVKEEMSGPGWKRSDIQEEVKERIDEFKASPYVTEKDEVRAEAIINSRAAGANDKERAKIRADVMDELLEQKETKFRLNSLGYKAANDALKEQFPYYIADARWTPPRNVEQTIHPEQDKGYVEPGRNRPTQANAGWYGTKQNKGTGFISASQTNYQRGLYGPGPNVRAGGKFEAIKDEDEVVVGSGSDKKDTHEKRREKIAEAAQGRKVIEIAQKVQDAARADLNAETQARDEIARRLNYTSDDLKDETKMADFEGWAKSYLNHKDVKGRDTLRRQWEAATGMRNRTNFEEGQEMVWPKYAYKFSDKDAYKTGAKDTLVQKERAKVDSKTKAGIILNKPLSEHTDSELETEHATVKTMLEQLKEDPDIALDSSDLEKLNIDATSPGLAGLRNKPEKLKERLELIHRQRALNLVATDKVPTATPETTETRILNKTPPAEKSPQALAISSVRHVRSVVDQMKGWKKPEQAEIDILSAFATRLENEVADGKMTKKEDWEAFQEKPENKRAITQLNASMDALRQGEPEDLPAEEYEPSDEELKEIESVLKPKPKPPT